MNCPQCHERVPVWQAIWIGLEGSNCRKCGIRFYIERTRTKRERVVMSYIVGVLLFAALGIVEFTHEFYKVPKSLTPLILLFAIFCWGKCRLRTTTQYCPISRHKSGFTLVGCLLTVGYFFAVSWLSQMPIRPGIAFCLVWPIWLLSGVFLFMASIADSSAGTPQDEDGR